MKANEQAPASPLSDGLCEQKNLICLLLDAMSIAGRYNRNLSLILLEIQADDKLSLSWHEYLQAVADHLTTGLRLPDRIGCFGHNTLVLLLPETDAKSASHVANRCQDLHVLNEQQHEVATITRAVVASYHIGDDLQSLLDRLQGSLSGSTVAVA